MNDPIQKSLLFHKRNDYFCYSQKVSWGSFPEAGEKKIKDKTASQYKEAVIKKLKIKLKKIKDKR